MYADTIPDPHTLVPVLRDFESVHSRQCIRCELADLDEEFGIHLSADCIGH
ncbi:hypothetical protein ABZV60_35465 [Streptomyces sp. NPDC004787]|uniref:hypothetical protein n=1 Tax=Streptomyces sp. NPDC004787 TaxID=3154291 RepID=UPI00339F95A0